MRVRSGWRLLGLLSRRAFAVRNTSRDAEAIGQEDVTEGGLGT